MSVNIELSPQLVVWCSVFASNFTPGAATVSVTSVPHDVSINHTHEYRILHDNLSSAAYTRLPVSEVLTTWKAYEVFLCVNSKGNIYNNGWHIAYGFFQSVRLDLHLLARSYKSQSPCRNELRTIDDRLVEYKHAPYSEFTVFACMTDNIKQSRALYIYLYRSNHSLILALITILIYTH